VVAPAESSVIELIAACHRFAKDYYRGSSEYDATLVTLRHVKELYG
jgi:hypothetical protein